jgi:hypothetical protein
VRQLREARATLSNPAALPAPQIRPGVLAELDEELRDARLYHFLVRGKQALAENPLTPAERAEYDEPINQFKQIGLAFRIFADDNGQHEYPEQIENLPPYLLAELRRAFEVLGFDQDPGRFEYFYRRQAEIKVQMPVFWTALPDHRGIRLIVLGDGSVDLIRDPDQTGF